MAINQPASISPVEAHGRERTALRAGHARIAIGGLGFCASFFIAGAERYTGALAAYLGLAFVFQWIIARRGLKTGARIMAMGVVDTLFASFFVQRLGTLTSVLPLIYVMTPVLYATTTPWRRISLALAFFGTATYAALVLLEQLGLLAYAPATPLVPRPDPATAVAYVCLVALCASVTAALTGRLIAALGLANARFRDLSQHDELSGLYNRRYVIQRLGAEVARIARNPGVVTVALIDLDHFKRVNDEIGHDTGDLVLKAVAGALLSATRKADVVARYGGDEFIILLPDTEAVGAAAVGVRILEQARTAAREVCPTIPVSVSIGTTKLLPTDDTSEVIRRMDEQLYAAKRAGGDRLCAG